MRDDEHSYFAEIQGDINRTSVELLLIDADVALTFISIAETAEGRETVERNIHNARKAHDSIQHLRVRYILTDTQTKTLNSRVLEVRRRLEALGEKL